MKQTVYFDDFRQAFKQMGRENQFSYEGLKTLFEMLEDYEHGSDQEIELDVIALCCDFTEYDSIEEIKGSYECINSEDDLAEHTWYAKTATNGYIAHIF